jgi:enoyl-CoA hydratase
VIRSEVRDHVAEVVIDNPPVNALPVAGWFTLAGAIRRHGSDPEVRALIVAASPEIKGYQAGVDIKELAADPTHETLIGVNRGCWETFAAVYDCEVPVIAAVHGYCVGGGVGIAGNADIVVAADDATFGLPEVDRGALGVATHLSRLVPLHKMRAMFLMGTMATAQQLHEWGSVERVVPRDQLMDAAREIGQTIAAKSPLVIRRAKESLNAIDPVDVKRSYRFEQGFTYELNLWGDSDELRRAFIEKRDPNLQGEHKPPDAPRPGARGHRVPESGA